MKGKSQKNNGFDTQNYLFDICKHTFKSITLHYLSG